MRSHQSSQTSIKLLQISNLDVSDESGLSIISLLCKVYNRSSIKSTFSMFSYSN